MSDPQTMRRFRNDTDVVVVASIGHAVSPGQDIEVLMDADAPCPANLTETTGLSRFAQPEAEVVEPEPEVVPEPPPVEQEQPALIAEVASDPQPPEVVA